MIPDPTTKIKTAVEPAFTPKLIDRYFNTKTQRYGTTILLTVYFLFANPVTKTKNYFQ